MAIMIKRWAVTSGYNKGTKVEAYQYSDGSIHYCFRDRLGRPDNIKDKEEAEKIIKIWHMEIVTERKIMTNYYFKTSLWGTESRCIIDEHTMEEAEQGKNYLNPDDFDFLCEAESMEEAEARYDKEQSDSIFNKIAEANHF